MKLRIFMVVIISLFFIAETSAQYRSRSDAPSIGVGPQIGYHKSTDADDGRIMVGAFIRAKFSQAFGLEGSINYRGEDYENGAITISQWPVLVSALIYPFPSIYGIAGIGWYFSTVSYEGTTWESDLEDRTKNPLGFHLGAGLELPLGEVIKLTGDIKYVFLNYDLENIDDVPLSDLSSNYYVISVGLAFGLK